MIILMYSVTLTPRTSLSEISKNILKANYLKVSYLNCVTFIVWDTYFRFYDYSDSIETALCYTSLHLPADSVASCNALLTWAQITEHSIHWARNRQATPPRSPFAPTLYLLRHLRAPQPALPFSDLFSLVAVLGQSTKRGELCYSKCTQQSHLNVWSTNSVRNWNDFDIKP